MKIDYQKILKEVEGFAPQRLSTKKKFEERNIDREAEVYDLYFSNRHHYTDENVVRKFYNHLKSQGLKGTMFSFIHRHYNHNKIYHIKGKGIFSFMIRNYYIDSVPFAIEITRNEIQLAFNKQLFNLHDKSERFAASMYFTFDYDCLVKIQNILKKKPSGFYYIYID